MRSLIFITGIVVGFLMAAEPDVIQQIRTKYVNQGKTIKDITIVQEDPDLGEVKTMRKGVKSRIELNMPAGEGETVKTIIVFDSLEYWMISPIIGRRKISAAEAKTYQQEEWQENLVKARVVGEGEFAGKSCYILEINISEKDGIIEKVWVDKKDLNTLKIEVTQDKKTIATVYSDFRKVFENITMPFKIETFEDGKLVHTMIFKEIKVNQGLSDDLFNVDKIEVKFASPEEIMKMFR